MKLLASPAVVIITGSQTTGGLTPIGRAFPAVETIREVFGQSVAIVSGTLPAVEAVRYSVSTPPAMEAILDGLDAFPAMESICDVLGSFWAVVRVKTILVSVDAFPAVEAASDVVGAFVTVVARVELSGGDGGSEGAAEGGEEDEGGEGGELGHAFFGLGFKVKLDCVPKGCVDDGR